MARHFTSMALLVGLTPMVATVPAKPADAITPKCSGATVAQTDIDGDARRDSVIVRKVRGGDRPVHRLCVKTASGKVSNVLDTADWQFYDDPVLFGVAGMDGARGNEIILRSGYGAHSQTFHVYHWSGGRLVRQNAPDSRTPEWTIDAAASVVKGYRFSTSRGVRHLVASYGGENPSASTFTVTQTTYRWRKGAWQRVGASKTAMRDGSKAFMNTVGWHGISVPRGY